MDDDEWAALVARVKEASDAVNKTVTEGISLPVGQRSNLNLAMPNWEDQRLQLTIPASSPFKPTVRFSLGADLDWHQTIKDYSASLFNDMVSRLMK